MRRGQDIRKEGQGRQVDAMTNQAARYVVDSWLKMYDRSVPKSIVTGKRQMTPQQWLLTQPGKSQLEALALSQQVPLDMVEAMVNTIQPAGKQKAGQPQPGADIDTPPDVPPEGGVNPNDPLGVL